jgi:type II secretory pathway component PulC
MEIVPSVHGPNLKRLVPLVLFLGAGAIFVHRLEGVRATGVVNFRPDPVVWIRRSVSGAVLEDPFRFINGIRIVPSLRDGRPNGFKIYAVRPDSVFARLGLQNGDLILGVNGRSFHTPDAALETFNSFRSAHRLMCEIERHGRKMILAIEILRAK